MSVYAPDKAMINGIEAPWVPGALPTRDWGPIRAGYWDSDSISGVPNFQLGRYDRLARFFSASRSTQSFPTPPPIAEIETESDA